MMYLFVIGGVGAAVLALVFVRLLKSLRKKRKRKAAFELAKERQAEIREWAEGILALGDDIGALVESGPMPHMSNSGAYLVEGYTWCLHTEVKSLVRKAEANRNAAFGAKDGVYEVRRWLDEKPRERGLFGALEYLLGEGSLARKYIEQALSTSLDDVRQELEGLVVGYINWSADKARRGDAEAFDKLMQFFDKIGSGWSVRNYKKVGMSFEYPSDWNDLVARFYRSPAVHHFIGLEPNRQTGYWRQQAAEVLRRRGSLTDALMVLAVADQRTHHGHVWREEIGDRLLSDLAKLVTRLRAGQAANII